MALTDAVPGRDAALKRVPVSGASLAGVEQGTGAPVVLVHGAPAAVERPRLMRSLFVYEPGFPTWVSDPEQLREVSADAERMFGPASAAVQRGDNEAAVRALIDGSSGRDGYFDSQPEDRRRIQLDNARRRDSSASRRMRCARRCAMAEARARPSPI